MTKAFAMRWPDDVLTRAKAAAHDAGTSFTAYVLEATVIRLDAPPLTEVPMEPVLAPRDTCPKCHVSAPWHHPGCPDEPVRGAPERMGKDQCAHPFRNEFGVCKLCGNQR